MNDPFDINLVDAPPGPRPYTLTVPLTPFTVTLPDEILRIVFEMSIFDSQYAANQLMLVARWVQLWLLQTFYTLQRIISKKHLQRLILRPNSLLAHVRSIHVCFYHRKLLRELLERSPNLERLAVCHDALLAPSTRTVNTESRTPTRCAQLFGSWRQLRMTIGAASIVRCIMTLRQLRSATSPTRALASRTSLCSGDSQTQSMWYFLS